MADRKVKVTVEAGSKGLKMASKDAAKLAKETDKIDKSQKKAEKSGNKYHKLQKGVAQAGANSTKNFSKMNQSMGGSSGLVAAYATLAANVFAATAAFGALSRAAEFENLKKGLTELGAQSGRTLSIMADGLREVTGGAISAEEAMRGAALGVSGGFGGAQLEGLAKIAKGASIALGRNLPDAFDRLTRGAIKLEPEILDELGIMVRLDDAVENYAATIGKSATSLTMFERRQAFMNAILEQGEEKFGEIAEAVDTDPYARLGATFGDLTKDIFTFINETLFLGDIMGFLADNTAVLMGTMVLFGSTIAAKMLPFLSDSAASAANAAKGMSEMADAAADAVKTQKDLASAMIGTTGGGSKAYQNMAKSIREGKGELSMYKTMQGSLNKTTAALQSLEDRGAVKDAVRHKAKKVAAAQEQQNLNILIGLETQRGATAAAAAIATARSTQAMANVGIVQAYAMGHTSLWGAVKGLKGGYSALAIELDAIAAKQIGVNVTALGPGTKLMNRMKAAVFQLGTAFRLLGKAILKAWLPIGVIIIAVSAAIAIFKHFFNTAEAQAYHKVLEDMDKIMADIVIKAKKYQEAIANTKDFAFGQIRAYKVQSGIISEVSEQITKGAKARLKWETALVKKLKEKDGLYFNEEKAIQRINQELQGFQGDPMDRAGGQPWTTTGAAGKARKALQEDMGMEVTGKADKGLAHLFAVQNSPEYKGLQTILKSEIPHLVEAMQKEMKGVMAMEFVDARKSAHNLGFAIHEVQKRFASLGPAAEEMRTALREAEKESSKFLQSFQKKTKVDAVVDSFRAVEQSMKALEAAQETAWPDDHDRENIIAMGIALSDVGKLTGSMIGSAFTEAQAALEKVQKKMDDIAPILRYGAVWKALVKSKEEAAFALGLQTKEFKRMAKEMKLVQRLEIQRKKILDLSNQVLKSMNKNYKVSTALAKTGGQMQRAILLFEQKSTALQILALKKTFEGMKIKRTYLNHAGEEVVLTESITLAEILKLETLEEQIAVVEKYSRESGNLFTIRNALLKQAMHELDLIHQMDNAGDIARIREIEALQQINKLTEDLRLKRQAIADNTVLIEKFGATGKTELNAAEQAEKTVAAAKAAAEFARVNLGKEHELLAAKGRIQLAEFELTNKKIMLMNAELRVMDEAGKLEGGFTAIEELDEIQLAIDIDQQTRIAQELATTVVQELEQGVTIAIIQGIKNVREAMVSGELGSATGMESIGRLSTETTTVTDDQGNKTGTTGGEVSRGEKLQAAGAVVDTFAAKLMELGPEGQAYAVMSQGLMGLANNMAAFAEAGAGSAEKMDAVVGMMGSIGSAMAGAAQVGIAAIEQQIQAEEKRDGKSKESLKKIQQMKMKKYQMEKKAFEQNKKIAIATALMSTFVGVAKGIEKGFPIGYIEAAITLAMGMAQVKAIQGTQFAGAKPGGGGLSAPNTALNIGKRSSSVDVSRGATGGELGYLRGQRGYGKGADFVPTGGAAGLRRGYGAGGDILVGEQGPEVITPSRGGYEVIPNDKLGGGAGNVNFTINAVDAAGVEDVLLRQRGHIIGMIREAANDTGERFLESVDTDVVGGG